MRSVDCSYDPSPKKGPVEFNAGFDPTSVIAPSEPAAKLEQKPAEVQTSKGKQAAK